MGTGKPNVGKASLIMVLSLLLSRVLGFVREMVIAGKFGQSIYTDAYFLSFQIPDILFYLIAGGALSSAFIPVFTEYLHSDREEEAWHIFSVIITVMSVIIFAFIGIAMVFAEPLVHVVASNPTEEMIELVAYMSRVIVPAQYAFFIGGVMLGTLYARQVFSVPGLAPNIYNIGIIVGALVLSNFMVAGFEVAGMSWGALAGAFLGNIFIPLLVIRKLGMKFKISFDLKHPGVQQVLKMMLPVVLGLSLPGVFTIILKYFGSTYQEGVLSALEYGNRLMQAPLGVFGQALALAAFPALAQFFAQNEMSAFRDQVGKTVRTVIFLTLPIAAIFIAMPEPIIAGLFARNEFGADEIARTAPILQTFGIGVAAWCIHPTLMRAFFAVQKTWPPILLGSATTVVFATAAYFLTQAEVAPAILPVAASVAAILLAVAMVAAVHQKIGELDIAGILTTLGKSILAASVIGVISWLISEPLLQFEGRFSNLLLLAATGFSAVCLAWVYYGIAKLLKMPETAYVRAKPRDSEQA